MNSLFLSVILLIVCVGSISGQVCFLCQNCPVPFYRDSSVVTQYSSTGFCAKKSYYSYPGGLASRGPAEPGLCYTSGCTSRYDTTGRIIYVCCCRSNYCNTGSFTSKSTITVLLSALALLAVHRYV